MRYDTVIFDLDGTLLDTLDDLTDGVNHALREFGFPEASRDEIRARLGYGSGYLIAQSVPGGRDCRCIRRFSTPTSPITAPTAR